ncbi:CDP-diacylglycerol--serine O-phosphatidyltransferase [Paenibacillus sp. RRE4]|jgi:CDP-diacylglycerol--serine O-phosphatidyltransferase|uniref:CDP-diacylglycerol--serine O-phosphatidyltransferase n=1 Tax=Paenibacillus amylolyticus TaxID=1451 RepID=A0A5M9WWZ5_PAEAM|nr:MULTISPECIES: CDP-diacylglycerol--serine O-phosphatidyltransferase [Paenibacillus]KAA8786190.1 CDP-diacylglycerol--serine O-phosphatidyltransferase [Paenibacillus amylolyticus]MDT0121044.1 CDP-diacylglycerol--serine O-phosphatidyltransferase [Paenibacillus sp. RRE4]
MKSLPSILTLGNLSSGMLAVIMAIHGEFALAVTMIWVAMFFDLFDGYAARKLHCEGEFGKALDSLADVVSFGTAPVLILYLNSMTEVGMLGMALTALFPVCGALRLARYNCQKTPVSGFVGMPITFAGGLMSFFALWSPYFNHAVAYLVIVVLSGLMVSQIRFPSLKQILPSHEKDIVEPK